MRARRFCPATRLDTAAWLHDRLPPLASQPTPIAVTGGPYVAQPPYPSSVTLNGAGSKCAEVPCTGVCPSSTCVYSVSRGHSSIPPALSRPSVYTGGSAEEVRGSSDPFQDIKRPLRPAHGWPLTRTPQHLSACACAVERDVLGRPERPEDRRDRRFALFWSPREGAGGGCCPQ